MNGLWNKHKTRAAVLQCSGDSSRPSNVLEKRTCIGCHCHLGSALPVYKIENYFSASFSQRRRCYGSASTHLEAAVWPPKLRKRTPPQARHNVYHDKLIRAHVVLATGIGRLSYVSWTAAIVFSVAAFRVAGDKSLRASGMLQALYLTTMPGIASVSPFICEMWLEALPSQARSRVLPTLQSVMLWV